jgi:hypothetical protein
MSREKAGSRQWGIGNRDSEKRARTERTENRKTRAQKNQSTEKPEHRKTRAQKNQSTEKPEHRKTREQKNQSTEFPVLYALCPVLCSELARRKVLSRNGPTDFPGTVLLVEARDQIF